MSTCTHMSVLMNSAEFRLELIRNKKGKTMSKTPKERLAEGLKPVGDCLEWQGAKSSGGYGQLAVDGRSLGTHRLAWVLANECAIPDGLYVLHSCDNPSCCNPAHLHLGTQLSNMAEMYERGRQPERQGMNLKCSDDPYSKIDPSPGMARLIATYNRNKARRLAREAANAN